MAQIKNIAIFISLIFFQSYLAHSFTMIPMTTSIDPEDKRPGVTYQLTNNSDKSIAIEVSIKKRSMDEFGVEKNEPIQGEFLLVQGQFIISPNASKNFRIEYMGPKIVDVEQAYRVIAEQLPIELIKEKKKANINIMFRYVGGLYITPSSSKPKVIFETAYGQENDLMVVMKNTGTKHQILSNLTLTIIGEGDNGAPWNKQFPDTVLNGFNGENILAGSTRHFKVAGALVKGLNLKKPVSIEFKIN